MAHHKRKTCRICGSSDLRLFLSLGPTPLANSFLASPDDFEKESVYPLDAYFCETCSLVQLLDVIDPEVLFRNYIYLSGMSESIATHNVEYAQTLAELLGLSQGDVVVEIGSNDGSLLKCFEPYRVKSLGIEPATNIAEIANNKGIETLNDFFSFAKATEIRSTYGAAKVVTANNVLAHVDQTKDFLRGCRELLHEDGLVAIEVPYLLELLEKLEYDTIYHEHLCYFSINSLMHLCEAVGLSIVRIDRLPIHGGSLRMYAANRDRYPDHSTEVKALAKNESMAGLTSIHRYESFAADVENNRRAICDFLDNLVDSGKVLAAYGAPAKGNTLLNYCKIGTRIIPYTVDKNPFKIGLFTPGMHIPVMPVSTLLERQPDYVLILAWNFAEEIMRQQREYHDRGGHFIIPIPEPKVV